MWCLGLTTRAGTGCTTHDIALALIYVIGAIQIGLYHADTTVLSYMYNSTLTTYHIYSNSVHVAVATINFVPASVRLLTEGGSYLRAATIVLTRTSTHVQYICMHIHTSMHVLCVHMYNVLAHCSYYSRTVLIS